MNSWKLSTIILASVLAGFLLAQVTGLGLVSARNGATAKVQLDTGNCGYGVGPDFKVPSGAFVTQVVQGKDYQMYVYDVCQ